MNKKIVIGSIFAAIILISLPVISAPQIRQSESVTIKDTNERCDICPRVINGLNIIRPFCILLDLIIQLGDSIIDALRDAGFTDTADYFESAQLAELKVIHELWCFW